MASTPAEKVILKAKGFHLDGLTLRPKDGLLIFCSDKRTRYGPVSGVLVQPYCLEVVAVSTASS